MRTFVATVLQAARDLVDPVPQPIAPEEPLMSRGNVRDPGPAPWFPGQVVLGHGLRHGHVDDPYAVGPGDVPLPFGRPLSTRKEYLPVTSEGSLCEKCQAEVIAAGGGQRIVPVRVRPGQRVRIVARPQVTAFRPEQIEIENAERWTVHDIKVGNRSQFSQAGDMPGVMFAPGVQGGAVSMETVQTAMDLVFEVTYMGPEIEGEQFRARVTGAVCN